MSHLVDARGDRQDEDIVLPGLDLHTVGITHPEPLLGNLGHLIPALTDGVFMVENIALHLQVGPTFDLDCPALTQGCDQSLLDHGYLIPTGALDFHAILDAQHALLDIGQLRTSAVLENERLTHSQGLTIHFEYLLTAVVFNTATLTQRK